MQAETTTKIEQYRSELPKKREKIFAAAMMLAIAIITAASATYAWITLSASPEVTSIDTTVAANGSLEIALANGTGAAPGKSAAGDSAGADSNVVRANTTWGNLVNLSDPSYGLSSVTLRPATLTGATGLLTNPLSGVVYGEDGRVSKMTGGDTFRYAYFHEKSDNFLIDTNDDHLGIRAISSVTYTDVGTAAAFRELNSEAQSKLAAAVQSYKNVTTNESYISAIEGMMGLFAGAKVNGSDINTVDVSEYVPGLYAMMLDYQKNVMDVTAECYVQMVNMLSLLKNSEPNAGYDAQGLISAAQAGTLPSYITDTVKSLSSFAADYTALAGYMKDSAKGDFTDLTTDEQQKSLAYWNYQAGNGVAVYWSNIEGMVDFLCDVQNATLEEIALKDINKKTALGILKPNMSAVLQKGASLCKTEQRLGEKMSTALEVPVRMSTEEGAEPMNLTATLSTAAKEPFEIPQEIKAINGMKPTEFKGGDATAEDTYALAVDLWVRTNAGAAATAEATVEKAEDGTTTTTTEPVRAYLTLEGKVRYDEKSVQETVIISGTTYYAFTAVGTVQNNVKVDKTIYSAKEDGSDNIWYSYEVTVDNKEEWTNITGEVDRWGTGVKKEAKVWTYRVVTGYDGVNRVWSSNDMEMYTVEGAASTTQGGGSCYIFYADSEEQQSRFLELLGAMRVAFINSEGSLIGTAAMDTKNYYAENGKVTVPLTLDTGKAIDLGKDDDGNTVYGLMALTKNAATRITAIIYLDGTNLTNQMVLANGDIQGNLNIQFGSYTASKVVTVDADGTKTTTYTHDSTQDNDPIENEKVMSETVKVTAALVGSTEVEFDPVNPAAATVKVTIEGKEPQTVGVRFIRAISATQGVQQEMATLTGSGADWSGSVQFATAGKFVLRSVWVDGTEYALSEALTFTVKGASVTSATVDAVSGSYAEIMQSDSTFRTNVTVGFAQSSQTLKRVTGIFMDENGRQVNAPLTLVSGTGDWKGTAVFSTSGTYTLKYVEIDGQQSEISESLQRTLKLQLGISAEVKISASAETQAALKANYPEAVPTNFVYSGTEGVTLTTSVKLYDNRGTELTGLTGVKLYYGRSGSVLNGLDTDLTWDSRSGSYTGEFKVTGAGVFSFSKVTVALSGVDSTVTSAKSAPDIRSMTKDEIAYYSNETETYQFVPDADGYFKIKMTNSSAAVKAEAEITDGARTLTAAGEMGATSGAETLWSFAIPDNGNWTMKSVTMYGVWYEEKYYDAGSGAKIDLAAEDITAKVVRKLYVTVSGESESFTGDVMAEHTAKDMTVTVVDFEGKPYGADGEGISNLEMNYILNVAATSQDPSEYGFESVTGSSNVTVNGTVAQSSKTEYKVSGMIFQLAGLYDSCSVTFRIGDSMYTTGDKGIDLRYATDTCPTKTVTWNTPDAQVYEVWQPYMIEGSGCTENKLSWRQITNAQISSGTGFADQTNGLKASAYEVSGLWWQKESSFTNYPGIRLSLNGINKAYYESYSINVELAKVTYEKNESTDKYEYRVDMTATKTKTVTFGSNGISYNSTLNESQGKSAPGVLYLGFSNKQWTGDNGENNDNHCGTNSTDLSKSDAVKYKSCQTIDKLNVTTEKIEYAINLLKPITVDVKYEDETSTSYVKWDS